MSLTVAHSIGTDLWGADYMIDKRVFTDGDERTIVRHSVGPSATCYVEVLVWVSRGEVWVEYTEGDVRRSREILTTEEFDPDRDVWEYVYPAE